MEALLTLFESLTQQLEQLTELAKRKTITVRKNDLLALDQILKEEQAIALSLRGLEQKRVTLLQQLGLQNIPLSDLPMHAPDMLRQKTKTTVDHLKSQYQIYNSAAQVARNTLECNLHEIEKFLESSGVEQPAFTGYSPTEVDAPPPMKADFRA
ncbi:MAG: flagellar export chaperone FlgN [Oscillospiraceae bacterium]|nr:flagellar export chaperone FlgN [Oscillospiraceae bacterium]